MNKRRTVKAVGSLADSAFITVFNDKYDEMIRAGWVFVELGDVKIEYKLEEEVVAAELVFECGK